MYNFHVDTNELFSRNLARFRKLRGYSLRELAAKTGISHRMISHYESTPVSVPFKNIKILADVLGVGISDFFDEEESSNVLDSLDARLIKKVQEIQTLSESDRKEIVRHINSLLEKTNLKKNSTNEQ